MTASTLSCQTHNLTSCNLLHVARFMDQVSMDHSIPITLYNLKANSRLHALWWMGGQSSRCTGGKTKMENIDRSQFFTLNREVSPYDTRGHPFKIHPPSTKTVTRRKNFDIRVIELWNSLPDPVVCSSNTNMFKNRLDAYTKRRGTFYEHCAP